MKLYQAIFAVFLLVSPLVAQPVPRPRTMKIEGKVWQVKWNENLVYFDFATGKREDLDGLTDCNNHIIWFNPNDELADTIVHEVQHAISGCVDGRASLHWVIYHNSAGLARWIQQNPQWMRFIRSLPRPEGVE